MCQVSMIGDDWARRHLQWDIAARPSREEFEALKSEVEALRKLLLAAKEYDRSTGQPDCEADDKIALIKRIAALVGADLSDVFDRKD